MDSGSVHHKPLSGGFRTHDGNTVHERPYYQRISAFQPLICTQEYAGLETKVIAEGSCAKT